MNDFDTQSARNDPIYETGVNTFAQQGVATANSIANDPPESAFYTAPSSALYTVAFLLVAAAVFGLPLIY